MEKEKKSSWQILSAVDCGDKIEVRKHDGFKYLSWAWAWSFVRDKYPDASYHVREWDGKPWLYDENLGYMVETCVTIDGETIDMWLPVMDKANYAMRHIPYEVKTKNGPKRVEAATMTDINTATMRCLTKNIAMFGLGLYIYSGEEIPDAVKELAETEVLAIVKTIDSIDKLNEFYRSLTSYLKANKKVIEAFTAQKIEIQQNNVQ